MTWKQLQAVKTWPKKSGKADYLKFLNGERLTRAEAIKAKCYEGVNGEDTQPCTVETCPLRASASGNKGKPFTTNLMPCESPCGGSRLLTGSQRSARLATEPKEQKNLPMIGFFAA